MKRDAVDQIEIASPCTVPWSSMRGDDRVRFCGHCRQNVYNIEGFDRAEARRLVAAGEGRLCVRILRRCDGTVVTADCWARLRAARRRGILPLLAMLLVVAWAELVAIRIGLDGWRRLATKTTAPDPSFDPSFVPELRLEGLMSTRAMAGMMLIRRDSEPEPDWLRPRQDRAPPPQRATPHLSPPLVNRELAGLPD
jgi:hypothetical protein